VVKISDVGSLYFLRYSLWKLGLYKKPKWEDVDLQENGHKKKKSYRMQHNARDESLEACCLHHMHVLEVF
jgi:hypothetical protein